MRRLGRLLGVPSRLSFDSAIEWVVVSEEILGHARSAGWTLPRRVIAHAGIDHMLFPSRAPNPWRWELLCVGRIDPRKGVATAVRALSHLPAARLTVIGGGDEAHRSELVRLADELGVSGRVRFDRRLRERLADAYAEADAVLFPVLWEEPFGLVPLEAMAVGRPVVATGTGGSGEYLRDGHNCLLFEPRDDPTALARSIETLAGDAGLRDRLRAGGKQTAAEHGEDRFNTAVEAALLRATA